MLYVYARHYERSGFNMKQIHIRHIYPFVGILRLQSIMIFINIAKYSCTVIFHRRNLDSFYQMTWVHTLYEMTLQMQRFFSHGQKTSSGVHDNDMIFYHNDILQHIRIDIFIC